MNDQITPFFQQENSLFDCLDVFQSNPKHSNPHIPQYKEKETQVHQFKNNLPDQKMTNQLDNQEIQESDERIKFLTIQNPYIGKRAYSETSSSHQNMIQQNGIAKRQDKNQDHSKQHIYSKNYRLKKKEYVKTLQQENMFLKKKIDELQFRLRQQEIQINRLKFIPQQKQFGVQSLNQFFFNQVSLVMQKNKQNPVQYRNKYQPQDQFYKLFMKTYAQHGFGGSKKLQLLDYYFNQILEALLRDSERYFCLLCSKAKNGQSIQGLPQYNPINNKFYQILQPNQEKLKRLKYFQVNLHPMILDFIEACSEFSESYHKILKKIQTIHLFMRNNYTSNMDFARKRILQIQPWFQSHKYDKMMRNLRAQWLQYLRSCNHINQDKKQQLKNKKKKANV